MDDGEVWGARPLEPSLWASRPGEYSLQLCELLVRASGRRPQRRLP